MTIDIGLDIGGTKIAGAVFAADGTKLVEKIVPTPDNYDAFLSTCASLLRSLTENLTEPYGLGICLPGAIDHANGTVFAPNIPYLWGNPFHDDFACSIGRAFRMANDGNCIALAEALEGAGKGASSVLGITISTGVGSGFIVNGQIVDGPNGLTGEIGHLPLPYREPEDGPLVPCGCGQLGCIDKTISGGGLERLYTMMIGRTLEAPEISEQAEAGDADALRVLDHYYEMVAKAMITPIHSFDPEVIVVTGGLSKVPRLFDEVPKRWGKYCVIKEVKTRFVRAHFGALASLRGAALLGRDRA